MNEPKLIVAEPTAAVRGIALVLHGGRSKSRQPVRATQPAVLRMQPFVHALRRTHAGLAVAQVRYRVRGWNGAAHAPVADTCWALDRLARTFPDVPVALIGHSMGGRTAMYVAGHETVRVVVGLAPWIEAGDPVAPLAARRVLIAHGDRDRMTDPHASADYARAATGVAESVSFVSVSGERHAMLRRPRLWNDLCTGFVLGALLGEAQVGTNGAAATKVLEEALAGRHALVV